MDEDSNNSEDISDIEMELLNESLKTYSQKSYNEIRKVISKGFDQSTQSTGEIGRADTINLGGGTLESRVIQPPYPPQCLTDLIDGDSTASKSIEKKVRDSTSRKISIKPIGTIRPQETEEDLEDEAATDFYLSLIHI